MKKHTLRVLITALFIVPFSLVAMHHVLDHMSDGESVSTEVKKARLKFAAKYRNHLHRTTTSMINSTWCCGAIGAAAITGAIYSSFSPSDSLIEKLILLLSGPGLGMGAGVMVSYPATWLYCLLRSLWVKKDIKKNLVKCKFATREDALSWTKDEKLAPLLQERDQATRGARNLVNAQQIMEAFEEKRSINHGDPIYDNCKYASSFIAARAIIPSYPFIQTNN